VPVQVVECGCRVGAGDLGEDARAARVRVEEVGQVVDARVDYQPQAVFCVVLCNFLAGYAL
jgi:hypothetical protein